MATNKQGWKEIALAFYKEPEKRTARQRELTESGLCKASELVGVLSGIHLSDMSEELNGGTSGYWLPIRGDALCMCPGTFRRNHDILRGDAAVLFATMA